MSDCRTAHRRSENSGTRLTGHAGIGSLGSLSPTRDVEPPGQCMVQALCERTGRGDMGPYDGNKGHWQLDEQLAPILSFLQTCSCKA